MFVSFQTTNEDVGPGSFKTWFNSRALGLEAHKHSRSFKDFVWKRLSEHCRKKQMLQAIKTNYNVVNEIRRVSWIVGSSVSKRALLVWRQSISSHVLHLISQGAPRFSKFLSQTQSKYASWSLNEPFGSFLYPAVHITDYLGHACFMNLICALTYEVSPLGCYFMGFAEKENGSQ